MFHVMAFIAGGVLIGGAAWMFLWAYAAMFTWKESRFGVGNLVATGALVGYGSMLLFEGARLMLLGKI